MESVGAWIDVMVNFLAGLIHGILHWLGEGWQGISTLVSSLFFLFIGLLKSIFSFLNSNVFKSWIKIFISLIQAVSTPIALIGIAWFVTKKAEEDKKEQQKEDKLQATLSDYLKQMTTLLLDKELSTKDHEDPTARVARVLTITAIKALDSQRNQQLTNFLYEAKLIQEAEKESNSPLLLQNTNLEGANLKDANLYGANLYGASLEGANLEGANLYGANLKVANLKDANLNGAILYGAKLIVANLNGANLEDAILYGASLERASLEDANLNGANLKDAILYVAKVEKALFGNNEGIDEDMKADLIKRGAIFLEESIETDKT